MQRVLATAALALAGCTSVTEPSQQLEQGQYVLTEFGGRPVPAVVFETDYGTIRYADVLVYDSATIDSDSTFIRSYRTATLHTLPGTEPDTVESESGRYPGMVLLRDGALVLITTYPLFYGETLEFRPVTGGFLRRLRYALWTCTTVDQANQCEVVDDELLDASYLRR